MEKENQELLDQFATAALSALIAKSPFFDSNDGEHGKKITPNDLSQFKKDLTATAYEYGEWMMIAREDAKKWLKENDKFFNK